MPAPASGPTTATAAPPQARAAATAPLGPGTLLWRHAADLPNCAEVRTRPRERDSGEPDRG